MKTISGTRRPVSAESIARLADEGRDVSPYFTNSGKMMPAIEIDIDEDVIRTSGIQDREGKDS
jgi:hypothetical protein